MIIGQYKSCVILAAMLLLLGIGSVCAAGPVSEPNETSFLFRSQSPASGHENADTPGYHYGTTLYRIIAALLIVVLLGVASVYASKKLLPKWSAAQGKKIKVVETIHLGTRKTVHLLEVGNQQILIGTTPDSITKLADIFSEKGFPLGRTDTIEEAE